ncbi:MAG TPA: hypothetical protein VFI24_15155 [Pyrinomonadaceae bacterium]|nr:hypothetical protein [Pyrinomonadaceae bacterium]
MLSLRKQLFLFLVVLGLFSNSLGQESTSFKPCRAVVDRSSASPQSSGVWSAATEAHDGLVSVNYCAVFERGETSASRLPKERFREIPSDFMPFEMYGKPRNEKLRIDELPLEYSLYGDNVYEVRTTAIPDGPYLVIHLPSVKTEAEFKKLRVLYLTEDIVVPGLLKWKPMFEPPATDSDFASRTLRAEYDAMSAFRHSSGIARIVVASFDSEVYEAAAVDLFVQSVVGPPYVRSGDKFTYKITVLNLGIQPITAHEVVFSVDFSNADFLSMSTPSGKCGRSMQSTETFICEVDSIAPGASVEFTVTAKAVSFTPSKKLPRLVISSLTEVTSREKDYSPDNNRHYSVSTIILPKSH